MVVYTGFGHGITKPRSRRAVMRHNLAWFGHHLWGGPPPDFTAPDGMGAAPPWETSSPGSRP